MTTTEHQKHLGFTLTELVVVVAVVVILASWVAVSVSRAKFSAQSLACKANNKQFGIGFENFASQADEFPLLVNPKRLNPNQGLYWIETLSMSGLPPIDDSSGATSKAWKCPSAIVPQLWPAHEVYSFYGYNAYGLGDWQNLRGAGGKRVDGQAGLVPIKRSSIGSLSDFLVMGDGFLGSGSVVDDGKDLLWRHQGALGENNANARSRKRHDSRANVLFGDGHVEAVTFNELFEKPLTEARVIWNRDGRQ